MRSTRSTGRCARRWPQAWRIVKLDDSVNAVVLRAAGDRAFSAGLDIKSSYGQPDNVWNHEDPGEALSPKWQKMWKPVVCAVQGMCTAGAFYFVNESDVVICSDDATFFDSHVSAGLVCALEPIGLMRRVGLGETLRIALMGNDERVSADTALRIGLVSEVVAADRLWARAHEIAATIAAKPPSATQGTVKAIWESLDKPYRAALEQGLIYTRLGNPLGKAELAARGNGRGESEPTDPVMPDHPLQPADRRRAGPCSPTPPRSSTTANGSSWRQVAATRPAASRRSVEGRGQVGILLRNRPAHVAAFLGVLLAGGTVVVINPSRGDDRTTSRHRGAGLPLIIGDVRRPGDRWFAAAPDVDVFDLGPGTRDPLVTPGRRRRRRAAPGSRCGC